MKTRVRDFGERGIGISFSLPHDQAQFFSEELTENLRHNGNPSTIGVDFFLTPDEAVELGTKLIGLGYSSLQGIKDAVWAETDRRNAVGRNHGTVTDKPK